MAFFFRKIDIHEICINGNIIEIDDGAFFEGILTENKPM